MSVTKKELMDWLDTLADDQEIGIDEGGLALEAPESADGSYAYLEIGGLPEEGEDNSAYNPKDLRGVPRYKDEEEK